MKCEYEEWQNSYLKIKFMHEMLSKILEMHYKLQNSS